MSTPRVLIEIEGGAIQRIVTDGSVTFSIFDKDNLVGGETDETAYKEEGWGIEVVGKREFDELHQKAVDEWINEIAKNTESHE